MAASRSRFGKKIGQPTESHANVSPDSGSVKGRPSQVDGATVDAVKKKLKQAEAGSSQKHSNEDGRQSKKNEHQSKRNERQSKQNEHQSTQNEHQSKHTDHSKHPDHSKHQKPKKEEQKLKQSKTSKSSEKKHTKKHSNQPKVKLNIPLFLSVANLATVLRVRVPELLDQLEKLGFEDMTNDYILDGETAGLIAEEYGFEVNQDDNLGADLFPSPDPIDTAKLKSRSPIVTIMGHVDHGKTTILDFFRKSSIVKGEKGGITQHIGAFVVDTLASKKQITFLDTPGHAAFLSMRERGANLTDIVILVVAADDSVMPQTIEAIKHTKNAGVPMIVAINKCDRDNANPDKVVADLSRNGVDVEDYGGDVPTVRISAKKGTGMADLEEAIVAVAELLDLKGETVKVPVEGWILESQVKKGLGNVATFLVKKGLLKKGQILVAGTTWCKVRAMKDEHGKPVQVAGPSTPVELSGWKDVPEAGDFAIETRDETFAKKVVSNRERRKQQLDEASQVKDMNDQRLHRLKEAHRDEKIQEYQRDGFTLEEIKELDPYLFDTEHNTKKEIYFIVKADVSGSSEAVSQSIEGLGNSEIASHVLYDEVGAPTESDVERAKTSNGIILAFNIKVPKEILNTAIQSGVVIKQFGVIYHLIEDVIKTLTESLPQKYEKKILSKAEVKQIFTIGLKGKSTMDIAGSKIIDGVFKKNADVELVRDGEVVYSGKIQHLKMAKDDVLEVKKGAECGIALEGGPVVQEGDLIQTIEQIPIERHL